jgi:hypothetical protein
MTPIQRRKAIFLYDFTGIMAEPWNAAGYECWLFDGQHPPGIQRDGNLVRVGVWFAPADIEGQAHHIIDMVGSGIEFVAGFPECTDMAVSGAAHFKKKAAVDPEFQKKAAQLAILVAEVGALAVCPWVLENPVSVLSTLWRKPDHYFHPYEFGGYLPPNDVHPEYPEYIAARDAYPKRTCLWCGGGFVMPEKLPVPIPEGYSTQHRKLGGQI